MPYNGPGKNQVEKAGSKIRRVNRGEPGYGPEEYAAAVEVLRRYRSEFSEPLTRANNRLRGRLNKAGVDQMPTQRLKKLPTIIDKLTRHPTLSPWLMADIGGCRIVVPDLDALRRVEDSIMSGWQGGTGESADYISEPRESGYRALHCFVRDVQTNLLLEVQLRTELMHSWAQDVEGVSGLLGVNYKQEGDADYQEYMKNLSRLHHVVELGGDVPEGLAVTLRDQRDHIVQILRAQTPR